MQCALRKDRSSPAADFMDKLREADLEAASQAELPPDEQVASWHWFIAASERIADTGEPPHGRTHNQLQDGIWELKHLALRLTFFDTDGKGKDEPLIDRESYSRFQQRPWPEGFEEYLRLTTGFVKRSQKTPPKEIGFARLVRKEDLDHDRRQ